MIHLPTRWISILYNDTVAVRRFVALRRSLWIEILITVALRFSYIMIRHSRHNKTISYDFHEIDIKLYNDTVAVFETKSQRLDF